MFLGTAVLVCGRAAFGYEAYDLLEALLAKSRFPRVLNTTDIDLKPDDPTPLFTPNGDFNGDGLPDMAISGVQGLPGEKPVYFLLVGTAFANPVHYEKLFYKEYDRPVFLHQPGTTGEKDPGDQAFSATFCSDCSDGFDFYWDPDRETFDQKTWIKRVRRFQSVPHIPELELVPRETVDRALQIAGDLRDVKIFVAGVKKAGKQLGTRVKAAGPANAPASIVTVEIFEKKRKGETLYDAITIDAEKNVVVKRKKRFKLR